MEAHKSGFINNFARSLEGTATRQEIKDCLEKTQRSFLAMNTQQKMCDRLKREVKYGIAGDSNVSVAHPTSDLMKLTKTYREFITDADYDDADKEILLEIFTNGDMKIEMFDRLVKHLELQESLKTLYQERLRLTMGSQAVKNKA